MEVRRVMYNMHPEPQFDLLRNDAIDLTKDLNSAGVFDINLNMDIGATLFIPKFKGDLMDPMNDAGFHMNAHDEEDFLMFPILKNIGIVMPMYLQDENEDEYIFKVTVMDPARS